MNPQTHTSYETSEQLQEWGCDLDCDAKWVDNVIWDLTMQSDYETFGTQPRSEWLPAYDILNDICASHRVKLFGAAADEIAQKIFEMMIRGEKKKAEEIILASLSIQKCNK